MSTPTQTQTMQVMADSFVLKDKKKRRRSRKSKQNSPNQGLIFWLLTVLLRVPTVHISFLIILQTQTMTVLFCLRFFSAAKDLNFFWLK